MNTIVKWLIGIIFIFFAVIAVYAGFEMVMSGGNPGALSNAKSKFTNAFIGLFIVLAAWLLVDTLLKGLLKGGDGIVRNADFTYGPWSNIQCVGQYDPVTVPGRYTASGDNEAELNVSDIQARVGAVQSATQVTAYSDAALDALGITDTNQRKTFRALISQESSNCQKKIGPDTGGGRGRAYGCTQILVATAKEIDAKLDKKFSGLSNQQIAQMLVSDDAYAIKMGAYYYKEGLNKYGGNIDYALARYNGGYEALKNSQTCPGQKYYQCTANKGYAQTRHYVANIKAIAGKI